ncbi:MAG TPA: hypothetical protein VMP41_14995 [Acidimicrobiales bacterium]|nr:hypothetical protein [Acidimicrobiales bacterium]
MYDAPARPLFALKLEFDLSKVQPVSLPSRHRDQIVVELGESRVLVVTERKALTNGLQLDQLTQRFPPEHTAQDALGVLRHIATIPRPREFVPYEGAAGVHRSLERPYPVPVALGGPVSQRQSAAPEAPIERVEIGGVEHLPGMAERASDQRAQVGKWRSHAPLEFELSLCMHIECHERSIPLPRRAYASPGVDAEMSQRSAFAEP